MYTSNTVYIYFIFFWSNQYQLGFGFKCKDGDNHKLLILKGNINYH